MHCKTNHIYVTEWIIHIMRCLRGIIPALRSYSPYIVNHYDSSVNNDMITEWFEKGPVRSKDWFALIFHNIPIKYIKLAKTHHITFIGMWFGHYVYACEVGVSGRVSKLVYVYLVFICDVCDIWFYKWVNVHLRKLYIMFFISLWLF